MVVAICGRSGDVVKPLLKPQWWMRMKPLTRPAMAVVESGELVIRPELQRRQYLQWMRKLQDWCLSRQLWRGHQIRHIDQYRGTEREAREKVEQKLPGKKSTLKRDEDVLDTCFSSALWPFSALGWPDKTSDLEYFPNTTLENRLGHYTVLGNVIEPVDVLDGISVADLHQRLLHGNLAPSEVNNAQKYQKKAFPQGIPQVGADALRYSLTSYVQPPSGDVNFDIKTMHGLPKIL
ncbi:hypothetical protein J3459_018678 [Metarhizium acridum]|nr:hypothetical protein J3459_018678 [Metarhizium acridum]